MKFTSLKNWLVEKSVHDIEVSDIINYKTLDHYLANNFHNELFQATYAGDYDIDLDELGSPDEWANSDIGKEFILEKLNEMAFDILNTFQYEIINGQEEIIIWRAMSVKDNWIEHLAKEGKRIGQYWSYVFDGAETHNGYDIPNTMTVIMESSIKEIHIDWVDTLRLNMEPDNEEKEIRLFKNTPLKINKIWVKGKEIELPKIIKNKTFKA